MKEAVASLEAHECFTQKQLSFFSCNVFPRLGYMRKNKWDFLSSSNFCHISASRIMLNVIVAMCCKFVL
ncbi:hypothetical protein ABTG52_19215, partial [Acinetobacter baumannii]